MDISVSSFSACGRTHALTRANQITCAVSSVRMARADVGTEIDLNLLLMY